MHFQPLTDSKGPDGVVPPVQRGQTDGRDLSQDSGSDFGRPSGTSGKGGISYGRATFVHVMLVLFALLIIARASQHQIFNQSIWQQRADDQYVREAHMLTPRGTIMDAGGGVLAETRREVEIAISPRKAMEVKTERGRVIKTSDTRPLIRKHLGELRIPDSTIRRIFNDPRQRRVVLKQTFLPADADRFAGLAAVERRSVAVRVNSAPAGLRGIVGAVNDSGTGISGIERDLDSILKGVAGHASVILDGTGGRVRSPGLDVVEEQPGHTVVLTINRSLQEIAENALANARRSTGASGGDVVILDPRDGSILAMAGVRNGKPAMTSTPIAEAYEPGSVMKPFVISRLLDLQRVGPDDVVETENGRWELAGRTLRDEHKAERMSVRDVVRFSSNIGTAKLAMQMTRREEYEALRDFGFGAFTGVPYPAESRGRLALPADWGGMTSASVAIGYEMMATPLQIAAAYAAIATDGELLQPLLVREIRDAEGKVVFHQSRRVVRRVVSPATAALMREMLRGVVDSGTARAASLATFDVAGKSGTARRLIPGEAYAAGRYNASFAGIFPVDDPQYVIVARLIDPEGTYFGGIVSGTMVKGILQDALVARNASLDRAALARVVRAPVTATTSDSGETGDSFPDSSQSRLSRADAPERNDKSLSGTIRVTVDLPFDTSVQIATRSVRDVGRAPVPSLEGLDVRQAVVLLSTTGFRVLIKSGGQLRTLPDAGTMLDRGAEVTLIVPDFSVSSKTSSRRDGSRH